MHSSGSAGAPTSRPPEVISGLEIFGHSYVDSIVGTAITSALSTDNVSYCNLFASSVGIRKENIINHGWGGMQLITDSRQKGFSRVLSEIARTKVSYPFARTAGAAYLFNFGINEIGNNTPANQALVRSSFADCLTACISKARASAIYLAATSGQWAFGANFATSAATAQDWTSGTQTSKEASVVDSAGSSTATFTIPIGYMGEPICFNMVGLSGGSLIVTWGGTVTGTTSIVGRTDTLNGIALSAHSAHPVRFTAAANGLSAANAGQTITVRITTVSGSTFVLDGCWIESFKPSPVLVCNVNRLPETSYNIAFGDGVTTGVTTSFTSASAQFLSSTDAGQAITETDAQGAFTAGKTVSSVTNATTIVLSGNAAAAKTSIQVTLARRMRGYSSGTFYTTNTDFTAATIASHSAADAHITNMNATIAGVVALFGPMVQIVDMDAAIGADANLPANVYTYYADGLHCNDIGWQRCANACIKAASALRPENDGQSLGVLEVASSPVLGGGGDRRLIQSGQVYLPEFCTWGTDYPSVAGDMFAIPFFNTEAAVQWGATTVFVTNAPTTGTTIRVGIYDDFNLTGYPQCLRQEPTSGGAFAIGTPSANTVKNPGSFTNRNPHYGLYWLVFKVDAAPATAASFAAIQGPNRYLPNFTATGLIGGAVKPLPMAWKLQGQTAGAMPTNFPTGGLLSNTAPALAVTLTLL